MKKTEKIKKINRFLGSLKRHKIKYITLSVYDKLERIFEKLNIFLNKHFKVEDSRIPSAPNSSRFFQISRGDCRLVKNVRICISEYIYNHAYLKLEIGGEMLNVDETYYLRDNLIYAIKNILFTDFDRQFFEENNLSFFYDYGTAYKTLALIQKSTTQRDKFIWAW